jgi:protocatechuate 3,4-dioxygenase beta subunit
MTSDECGEVTGGVEIAIEHEGALFAAECPFGQAQLGEPPGERIIVTGPGLDGEGRPVANQLVEIWQTNSSGRYIHKRDQHPAPLDPHFTGTGRCLTGRTAPTEFTSTEPGPYPWKNHHNAWRPDAPHPRRGCRAAACKSP